MIDNQYIAIFTKVNDLAARCGLKPNEFAATLRPIEESPEGRYKLQFDSSDADHPQQNERFDNMMLILGLVREGEPKSFVAQPADIIDSLDTVLSQAPRPPFTGR